MSSLSKKMSSLGTHRSTSIGIASAAEEHKKRIARAHEEREERRMALNQVHRALIELVLPYFNIDKATAEEFIIDTAQQIKLLQNFVVKNGKQAIMFFYQLDDPISPEDSGRAPIPQNTKMGGPVQALLGPKGAAAGKGAPEKVLRMFVTDGTDEGLRGGFVVLMREKRDMEINMNTIANVLVVAVPPDEGAVLGMMEEQLARILRPSLQSVSKWGELDKSPADQFTVTTFLKRVDLFISILRGTVMSIENVVTMPEFYSELELEKVKTAQDCMAGAADPDYVKNVEEVILLWCKNIDLILTECEQVRYESGETGPYTELDNWRALNARYNSLIELIRSHNCRMAIQILHIAKSPTLEKWKELNNKLTDVANEAKDNMKYLYTLEKLCEPLYHNDPGLMLDSIPSLINAIRMIQNISRYYNTSERMTSLFVKVTNQMVKTCKNYLSANGTERIYNLPSSVTLKRIDDCIALNNKYRDTFLKTQSNMRDTSEKPFDFSEMYVFGKFEAFCRRLEKIRFILNTIDEYSRMRNCVMEGLEPISHKFQTLFNTTKNSNTDVLDHRNSEFEFEFQEFNSKLTSHQATLDSFMNASIDRTKTTLQALHLLSVFESLGIKRLKVQEKYDALFQNYEKDLEDVKNYYIRNYENPAIPRNTTPVAGRIMWARNLATRMHAPMKTFSERPDMLATTRGRAVLKAYNRMNRVLVEFELLYHTAWLKSISAISEALQEPPLVRHPDSRQLYVNLEATVYQVIQEACYMLKLGLEVPRHALLLVQMKSKLKRRHALLINLLKRDEVVREKIPESLQVMFESSLMRIDYLMRPALTSLTWTSINLDLYFARANGGLDELELYMDQIFDLKSTRIDRYVDTIGATILFDNDNIDGWTLSEFEVSTERYTSHCQTELSNMSFKVEEGLKELTVLLTKRAELMLADCASLAIDEEDNNSQQDGERDTGAENLSMLLSRRSKKEEMLMRDKLKETFVVSYNRLVEALARSSKISLDILRKRSSFIPIIHGEISRGPVDSRPFFQTFVILSGVHVTMQPSADELQLGIMRASSLMLEVSMGVQLWDQARIMPWVAERENKMAASPAAVATAGERNSTMAAGKKSQSSFSTAHDAGHDHRGTRKSNADLTALDTDVEDDERERKIQSSFYSVVAGHKDVLKVISELQTAMLTVKPLIAKSLNQFSTYSWIWTSDKKTVIETFMKTDPIISDFTQELKFYDHLEEEISDLDDHEHVGPLLLNRTNIKNTLKEQVAKLKQLLLKTMNEHYQEILGDIMTFIEEESTKLARPIKDLEDIRVTMLTLENIRAQFVDIDTSVPSVEEAYMLLSKYEYPVPQEESEMADGVRYKFKNLIQSMTQTMDHLLEIQPNYKSELISCIEELTADVNSYDIDYQLNGPMVEGITPSEASTRLFQFQTRYEQLKRNYVTYTTGEKLFGMPVSEYPLLNQYNKELGMLQKLYGLYNVVIETVNGYYDLLWTEVNIDKINADITDFQNKCKKLPKGMQEWQAFIDLKKTIDDFNETCPMLEMMTQKSMKDRHWERISNLTGHPFEVSSPDCRLRDIMEAPLLQFKDDIEDICVSSAKEQDIEAKLKAVITEWGGHEFAFGQFKSRGELLLKGTETTEIISFMDDSLMVLNSLLTNRYNTPFRRSIQEWVQNLSTSYDIIEKWMIVQNLWVYLEAVFVGGDIAKQLPAEAKRFSSIDKSWVRIMMKAHEDPNVIKCCVGDDIMGQLLPHLLDQLEVCQKSLTGYLEGKRLLFPRFFFVSDPALLEILGQASDPHTIQPHLLSVAENINEVMWHDKEYDKILAVVSMEKQTLQLEKSVKAVGNVESWLGDLLAEQQKSLHTVIRNVSMTIVDPEFNLIAFIAAELAQVSLLAIQMMWTLDAEEALGMAKFDKKIMQNTNQHFLDMLNVLIQQTLKDLTKYEMLTYNTLITIHVHQRDIFDDLYRMKIKSVKDFEWLKQLRVYFKEDEDRCIVSVTDVNFIYQNEYLGCTERLVITPLTDRCYITIAQSLGMSMGGAPAGPAGTGKTETTKDMAKALGKYCVVFNCSDQMDYRGLGRIFKGLAQSGSWGCFDEFNRIDLPVLSVAAQQIAIVLTAKKERKKEFLFSDGDTVSLNPEFGLFLTMNPGYAGRQELPENLKIQFRTVAMMVPDRQIIMRVKLASVGFLENIILAQKFFVLYKLCEEQLSKQVHYDFGLRNILSVLRMLGSEKRKRIGETESTIVMRVLRDMNLSKLVDEDEPLFLSLISDLFPGITLDSQTYDDLQVAIANQVREAKLINHPLWNLKVIQLYETQRVRHGMMTLGPTGAGKTCCIHLLMKAMTDCGAPHKEMRMNPKAITAPQMFGRLDVATNDWTDGIFSTLWRRTQKTKKGEYVWLVLDGPVDAIWIENLNSVLDDTKKLTLANGDRIPMAPNCKIIFEVHNIDNASPATVSRNGMVFMSSSCLDWNPILSGWLNHRSQNEAKLLLPLFGKVYDDLITFSITSFNKKMFLYQCMEIKQACDLLEGLLPAGRDTSASPKMMERLFIFVLMWSMGSLLELDDRAKMEEFLVTHPSKLNYPKLQEGETIFEYMVGDNGEWCHWSDIVPEYLYPNDSIPEFSSILVPNVDNTRTNFLMDTIAKQSKSVLLIGEQGTAKTVMIKGYMSKYNPEEHVFKSMNFSSATTPNLFQRIIESYVDKRVGTTYGPANGKKMTVFIDDINMPIVNEWGDQITNEITRQCIEMSGFYSLDKPGEFSSIVDIQFIAAMIHPGGGRNDIPERLKRQFCIFNCTLPSNSSIDRIFGSIGTGYFCEERNFQPNIINMCQTLIAATRTLWQITKIKMLPTPAKFHYVFNLRDLSRIWEGMLKVESEECRTDVQMLALWRYECTRVIADRFVDPKDGEWFQFAVRRVMKDTWGDELADQIPAEPYWVDFLRDAPDYTGEEADDVVIETPQIYELLSDYDTLEKRLQMFMGQYNEAIRGAPMDLVFFKDAMTHIVKILRVIRTPMGHALLVGVGGSGKQSLTKLASFISGYRYYQITLTRAYNTTNLMEDLKILYRVAGQEGRGISFIFTDNDIKDETFLESINSILSSGEVANLFARDETDEIQQALIGPMKKEFPRRPPTPENLNAYFFTRVRKNLHIVLCFSPVSEKFRTRALKFPGLIAGCTIDWFQQWPLDALVAVSSHVLSEFDIVSPPASKNQLIEFMGNVQEDIHINCHIYFDRFRRQTHVTPKSFLSFLASYKVLYAEKHTQLVQLSHRMTEGLKKLDEATVSVDLLSKDLAVKEKELVVANQKADKVLEEVKISAEAAEKVKAVVQVQKEKAETLVASIADEKGVAEEKLEKARPALEEAEAALQTIKPAHIATVRKLGKPPSLIMRIMDCVLILFQKRVDSYSVDPERGGPKPSWPEALKLLGSTTFLNQLLNFAKDLINEETVELLQPYLQMEDFNMESAKKVCGDVAGLASWVRAMAYFFGINKEVLPLKANLAVAEAKLKAAQSELAAAVAQLEEKERELKGVQDMYDAAMAEKQVLLDDANNCKRKMDAASTIINGLAGEKIRWTNQSKEFKASIERLIGDVMVLSGFLGYAGPFNQEFRSKFVQTWSKELRRRNIEHTAELSIISSLVDPTTISEWNLQGLPNDELSIQNGIIVTKAARYPLLIDPQGQGRVWIKNKEKKEELLVTTLTNKYFRQFLEDALSLGQPLLIENVEQELDPALNNVLEKNFIKSGTRLKVKIGDKECDYMDTFFVYITTKLPNPTYSPEICAMTSIIDFTVTIKGLEDQLLGRVILSEKAELESERIELVEGVVANNRKMKELEANLLHKLTSTEGSLVDDDSLITVLANTKATAAEVGEKLAVAADTEIKISRAREEFRPVATRGSILYFLLCELSLINCMYQTSLKQFLMLFDRSIDRSEPSPFTQKRLVNITEYLTYEVFRYTSRGLYEKHKFLLLLFLTLKKDMQAGNVRHVDFQVLIKGGAALDLNAVQPKPCKWITDMTWLNLVELSKLSGFADITNQIMRNEKAWKSWFDKEAPEEEIIPDNYSFSLDVFRKLLLIRAWCPDRIAAQARKYIAESMGPRYIEPILLDMRAMWEESDSRTPLICLLSMGSDPSAAIEDLAKKNTIECRAISMGQGQEVHARLLITNFMANGGWVLLQNCHLGLNYLDELLETVTFTETVHESFRLWITTEVHPEFSIGLLQISIRYSNDPPEGIRAGLKRTYQNFGQDFLDLVNAPQWKPMLFTISYIHTVVQERRKFGPLGWNIPYEFNIADWSSTIQFVQNHLDDMDAKKGVSWNTVRYMIGEIQYGGRVTDDYDKRLLNTFAKVWCSEKMFDEKFQFYLGYSIPRIRKIEDVRKHIEALPVTDSPEAFGLHPNADITCQSNVAREVLESILEIQPKDSSGAGETREAVVYRSADDMLRKMPKNYVVFEVRERLKLMGVLEPLNIFLKQEIDRMRRVIRTVYDTLVDLKLAIDGTIIMNENLRDVLDSIYDAKVPGSWRRISWPSSTIGFWFTEFLERNDQFNSWIFKGRPNSFLMTGFFNAQGFLTAMRQEVTRAHKGWSLDSVMLSNDVTKFTKEDINSPPPEGVYVYGLFLEGAGWDRRVSKLVQSTLKVLFTPLPVVHMFAIQTGPKDPKFYQCPVYKKPNRTDLTYVTAISMRTSANPDIWVLRGVAALCDIK